MKLSKKDVQHIANLARLDLTDEELEKYGGQLSDVLCSVKQLQDVDVTGVPPTAQITGLENVFREDIVESWENDEIEKAINEAPDTQNNQYKVKKVL